VTLELRLLDDRLAVSRLGPQDAVPAWAAEATGLVSITRTADELSLVTRDDVVPAGVVRASGWRALALVGTFDFALTGILVALLAPLADAGIGIFAFSTFDTDYVMVREADVEPATAALRAAGHDVSV
jgi:hypothetical protein